MFVYIYKYVCLGLQVCVCVFLVHRKKIWKSIHQTTEGSLERQNRDGEIERKDPIFRASLLIFFKVIIIIIQFFFLNHLLKDVTSVSAHKYKRYSCCHAPYHLAQYLFFFLKTYILFPHQAGAPKGNKTVLGLHFYFLYLKESKSLQVSRKYNISLEALLNVILYLAQQWA